MGASFSRIGVMLAAIFQNCNYVLLQWHASVIGFDALNLTAKAEVSWLFNYLGILVVVHDYETPGQAPKGHTHAKCIPKIGKNQKPVTIHPASQPKDESGKTKCHARDIHS